MLAAKQRGLGGCWRKIIKCHLAAHVNFCGKASVTSGDDKREIIAACRIVWQQTPTDQSAARGRHLAYYCRQVAGNSGVSALSCGETAACNGESAS